MTRARKYALARVAAALGTALAVVMSVLVAAPAVADVGEASDLRGPIVAARAAHEQIVSDVPVSWTPRILDGRTLDIAQVGDWIVVGGEFTQVTPAGGSPVLNRTNVFAFSAINGAINTNFAPSVSGGQVRTVEPGPIPGTVYLGGSFQGVNGVTRKIVLVDLATGALVPGFDGPSMNGAVNDLQLVGSRLYAGGVFKRVSSNEHLGLVSLDARTGERQDFLSVALTENHNYTGQANQAQAPVGAKAISVTPQGDQMAVIGNFRKADGLERRQMVLIDLTGPTAKVREDWQTTRMSPACFSNAFDTYVRDVDTSPDGSYFLVASTGGHNQGTLCDTVTRWDVTDSGQSVQPEWIEDAGGDTFLSVTSSGTAVYAGGHQRWANNDGGSDYPAAGAVPRPGIGGFDVSSGLPLTWNPGRNPRGVGADAVYVTPAGLWVGSDTEWIGNRDYRRQRIAFFPTAGGYTLGEGATGALPANVYVAGGQQPQVSAGAVLYRVNAGGPEVASLDGGPVWSADTASTHPYRTGGSDLASTPITGGVDGTVPPATPAQIYDTERWDSGALPEMSWNFPVDAGQQVVVRLYFANSYSGTSQVGQRVFDVALEGTTVLPSYDIVADVGHSRGTMKEFAVTSDGVINIDWTHRVENPLINAIEILERVPDTEPQPESTGLTRTWFTGGVVDEPVMTAPAGDVDWTQIRGAVVIDGVLWYGTTSGDLVRRTFDGSTYGPAELIDPYNDPYWSDVDTGSGGRTFRGTRPSFYGQIPTLTGMAYDAQRLYYTVAGSSRLYSRGFSPDSGILTQAQSVVPAFTSGALGGIFFDEAADTLYFVTAANGNLSRVGWTGREATGNPEVVSGPTIDGVDWRGRAAFIAEGPAAAVNQAPVAVLGVVCDRLECALDSVGSHDPDGSIVSYAWDFGDGSPVVQGEQVSHEFAEGDYTVTLTVTDNKGLTGSASELVSVRGNNPPVAVIGEPVCDLLECAFDGSGSSDPDTGDSVVSYEWGFGGGSDPVDGVTAAHVFPAAGEYTVTLTVTDQDGAVGSVEYVLSVSDGSGPVATAAELVGRSAVMQQQTSSAVVPVPSEVQAGDLLVLFVTTNNTGDGIGPAGVGDWELERRVVSATLVVSVFTRVADGAEAGQPVTMTWPGSYRTDLTMLAYRGVGDAGVEVLESAVAANTSSHTTPVVSVPGEERVALSFWADRSSSTTAWTAPAGLEVLSSQVGSGGGRVSTLITSQVVGAGLYGGLVANTDAVSARDATLTLLLDPKITITGPPSEVP